MATALAEAGADVAITSRSLEQARAAALEIAADTERKIYIWVIWPLGRVWAGESACPGEHSP
ncbi:MAG TPA: hypothetical protein VM537_12820 [Anaerolineae bacterium]|nr:hypothetical protein [Anaerolineae bacterium]